MQAQIRFFPAHVLSIFAVAVAQPVYEQISNNAEFFIIRGFTGFDILMFILLLSFGIPGLLLLASKIAGMIRADVAEPVRLSILFLLLFAMFMTGLRSLDSWFFHLVAAGLMAGFILWGYAKKSSIQSCFNFLIPSF